jgi:hypothetical protein
MRDQMAYIVTIECDVTDAVALEREARRLASASGFPEKEFNVYRDMNGGDPLAYCLVWLFDHGSPLEHGVQIEQIDVTRCQP